MGEFLAIKTLGEVGETGVCPPLLQLLLYGEGSPWLLYLIFQVSPCELELVCMSLRGGKGRVKATGPCVFVLGGLHQTFGLIGFNH